MVKIWYCLFNLEIHMILEFDIRILLILFWYNSSNGLSKFKMEVGKSQFVCENGTVVKLKIWVIL